MSEYLKNRLNNEPMFPEVDVQLTVSDGNAFVIMGNVTSALRRFLREDGLSGKEADEIIKQYQTESMSGNYDNLLSTAMKWVNVL